MFMNLLSIFHDGIVLTENENIIYSNNQMEEIFCLNGGNEQCKIGSNFEELSAINDAKTQKMKNREFIA
jgi:hypothetical protein